MADSAPRQPRTEPVMKGPQLDASGKLIERRDPGHIGHVADRIPAARIERRARPREGILREHCKTVVLRVLWQSNATTIRLVFACSSLLWAFGAWCNPRSFTEAPYATLAMYSFGMPVVAWGCLFMAHFVGVVWRIFDPVARVEWALVVNGYGLALWLSVTIVLSIAEGGLSASNSTEWSVCLFAAWALFLTGHRDDLVTA